MLPTTRVDTANAVRNASIHFLVDCLFSKVVSDVEHAAASLDMLLERSTPDAGQIVLKRMFCTKGWKETALLAAACRCPKCTCPEDVDAAPCGLVCATICVMQAATRAGRRAAEETCASAPFTGSSLARVFPWAVVEEGILRKPGLTAVSAVLTWSQDVCALLANPDGDAVWVTMHVNIIATSICRMLHMTASSGSVPAPQLTESLSGVVKVAAALCARMCRAATAQCSQAATLRPICTAMETCVLESRTQHLVPTFLQLVWGELGPNQISCGGQLTSVIQALANAAVRAGVARTFADSAMEALVPLAFAMERPAPRGRRTTPIIVPPSLGETAGGKPWHHWVKVVTSPNALACIWRICAGLYSWSLPGASVAVMLMEACVTAASDSVGSEVEHAAWQCILRLLRTRGGPALAPHFLRSDVLAACVHASQSAHQGIRETSFCILDVGCRHAPGLSTALASDRSALGSIVKTAGTLHLTTPIMLSACVSLCGRMASSDASEVAIRAIRESPTLPAVVWCSMHAQGDHSWFPHLRYDGHALAEILHGTAADIVSGVGLLPGAPHELGHTEAQRACVICLEDFHKADDHESTVCMPCCFRYMHRECVEAWHRANGLTCTYCNMHLPTSLFLSVWPQDTDVSMDST